MFPTNNTMEDTNILGPYLKNRNMEKLTIQGKTGKRGRGRLPTRFMDHVKEITNLSVPETMIAQKTVVEICLFSFLVIFYLIMVSIDFWRLHHVSNELSLD